jgi:DNA polymerase (family 10)
MSKDEIADIFYAIADMLEIQEANIFRVRAYRAAAHNIKSLSSPLSDLYSRDPLVLDNIPGIGKDLKEKILELLETGVLPYYEQLKAQFPEGFLDLLKIQGLGPKKLKKIHDTLHINNVDGLELACKKGYLQNIEGMGVKTQDKLIEAIAHFRKKHGRMLLPEADTIADEIMAYLSASGLFKKMEKAGSLRRGKETVGDIDILAVSNDNIKAMKYFTMFPRTENVIAEGRTKTSINIKNGPQVDLRIVDASCFGAALVYFTGSKEHNVSIRKIAKATGCKVSEYGVFDVRAKGKETFVAGKTEKEVYKKLGMKWIPPELRENRGEIDLALKGEIPEDLIEPGDIIGDLHMHSNETDGAGSIEDMIKACKYRGYEYMAITDHSKHVKIANGMDAKRLLRHCERIREVSGGIKGIKVLAGVEVDILKDGQLDIEDDVLKELDIVIAAIHSNFALSAKKQTSRILRAMDNKYVNILAHPSGRLITTRKGIDFDRDTVFKKAAENKIALEINTHGERIDLNDVNSRRAKEFGATFSINTDSHAVNQLDLIKYGVITARRGGLLKSDVINTYTRDKLIKFLNK